MRRLTRIIGLMVLGVLILGSVGGCNTIRGVGKDVQAGGRAIERAAPN